MRSDRIAGSRRLEPIGILLQLEKTIFEPAIRVAMFIGSRPNSKLFEIITHRREGTGMLPCGFAQKVRCFVDRPERQEIAQQLQARQHFDLVALIFGGVIAKYFIKDKASTEKMVVID